MRSFEAGRGPPPVVVVRRPTTKSCGVGWPPCFICVGISAGADSLNGGVAERSEVLVGWLVEHEGGDLDRGLFVEDPASALLAGLDPLGRFEPIARRAAALR